MRQWGRTKVVMPTELTADSSRPTPEKQQTEVRGQLAKRAQNPPAIPAESTEIVTLLDFDDADEWAS